MNATTRYFIIRANRDRDRDPLQNITININTLEGSNNITDLPKS